MMRMPYTCAIPCAIVEVVCKNFESLLVVIAKYKISMCVSVRLLTLSLIMFLMWLSGTRLHTNLLLTVPALTSSSALLL